MWLLYDVGGEYRVYKIKTNINEYKDMWLLYYVGGGEYRVYKIKTNKK
jgi:hypothetical protein